MSRYNNDYEPDWIIRLLAGGLVIAVIIGIGYLIDWVKHLL